MRIHIGSDHAGLDFKGVIINHLESNGHEVIDHGPHTFDPLDDYPVFCIPAAEGVVADPGSLGMFSGDREMASRSRQIKLKEFAQPSSGALIPQYLPASTTTQM